MTGGLTSDCDEELSSIDIGSGSSAFPASESAFSSSSSSSLDLVLIWLRLLSRLTGLVEVVGETDGAE
jgi:hypothetical protein